MTRYTLALVTTTQLVLIAGVASAVAQVANPHEGSPAAIRAGGALFGFRCSSCHGGDATGINGPDLTGLWVSGRTDERVFQTIRDGVAGSVMPASNAPDDEIWAMVAFLKNIGTVPPTDDAPGDAARGREIFEASCVRCHRVGNLGGRLGPDLSLIGTRRSRVALAAAIRDPSATMARGYRPVTLVTRDGARIRGVKKGEDAFSLQIVDTSERLQGYRRADLRELIDDERSLMPVFGADRIDDDGLDDLLQYLGTLRRNDAARP